MHPDDLPVLQRELQAHLRGETPSFACEHRVRCENGEYKWILGRGMVVSRDESGRPLRVVGTHSDISERKRLEAELQSSHDRLAKISQHVPGVIYQYRQYPDGRACFPYASDGIREIYEVTPEQVREDATPVFAVLHPDDHDASSLRSANRNAPCSPGAWTTASPCRAKASAGCPATPSRKGWRKAAPFGTATFPISPRKKPWTASSRKTSNAWNSPSKAPATACGTGT
ncbi:PAS domain-containing protein [Methylogaea oryzae]|uniref:PAS domain-containing protein n=1 Tax=Methylogaea oryzae TaxID=1295382 RepID=UPI003570FBF4